MATIKYLVVLYDGECGFCQWCMRWLQESPKYVPIQCLDRVSDAATRRYPGLLDPDRPDEMVVVDDRGGVYRATEAYLMCLWALAEYRPWAYRLAKPRLRPLVRHFFRVLARNRRVLSTWLNWWSDRRVADRLGRELVLDCATTSARPTRVYREAMERIRDKEHTL